MTDYEFGVGTFHIKYFVTITVKICYGRLLKSVLSI